MNLFLTGTDTGVGKTHTAVRILHAGRASGLRCAGMKPICCGDCRDAELLLAASSEGVTIDEINPIWLKTPAAPLSALLIEQCPIDEERLIDGLRELERRFDFIVVEGGGMARSDSARFFRERSRCAHETARARRRTESSRLP